MTIPFKHLNPGIMQFSNKFIHFFLDKTVPNQRQELPLDNGLRIFSSLHFKWTLKKKIKSMDVRSTQGTVVILLRNIGICLWDLCCERINGLGEEKKSAPLGFWSDFYHITWNYIGLLPKLRAPYSFSLRFQPRIRTAQVPPQDFLSA